MSLPPPPGKPPSASRGMLKRFALAAVVIVLLSTATTASALLLELDSDADLLAQNPQLKVAPGILDDVDAGSAKTIMVLGSDRRAFQGKSARGLSDTVMLVRFDPDKGTTSVMSLPRDLKVNINGSIDKLNAAYSFGGEQLTVKTVKALLAPHSPSGKFPISHVVNINFSGFQRAVNYFNCFYVDIDKKYFNDNNPPNGGQGPYAAIDVPAGYQRLCGQDSLDYVRFRHLDSDLVRGARQQEFMRQAKMQIPIGDLVSNYKELLKIIGRYTKTDIRGARQILSLSKLVINSSDKPLREVQFPGDVSGTFVTASDESLNRAVRRFLNPELGTGKPKAPVETDEASTKSSEKSKKAKRKKQNLASANVVAAKMEGEDQAVMLANKVAMPVLYPKVKAPASQYMTDQSRSYIIKDPESHKFASYRIVVWMPTAGAGQYYGIQGTRWKTPPILEDDKPDEVIKDGKRELLVYKDGARIRTIALKTNDCVYWVSNSLSLSLTNPQMREIAKSLRSI